jgi:hypothetical protein
MQLYVVRRAAQHDVRNYNRFTQEEEEYLKQGVTK